MLVWDPKQYLKFGAERGQAVLDLTARLAARLPRAQRIIDLGCGPGNSTAALARQWPGAAVSGLDQSESMLTEARRALPASQFHHGDIEAWAEAGGEPYELVFSNAALQWVEDLERLLPLMYARVAAGGALAFQVPGSWEAAAARIPRQMAASEGWRHLLPAIRFWHSHTLETIYDRLAPLAAGLEMWETEYIHIMESAAGILEWYKGSGLRPILQALEREADRERFCAEYLEQIEEAYPPRPDGRVLFPFRRRFAIAWAG